MYKLPSSVITVKKGCVQSRITSFPFRLVAQQLQSCNAKLLTTVVLQRSSSTGWKSPKLLRFVGECPLCMHMSVTKQGGVSNLYITVSVAPGTGGWSPCYRVAEGSWGCPESWEAKGACRCFGSWRSSAGVTTGRHKSLVNTTSPMAVWYRDWRRGSNSFSVGVSPQVHWISGNIQKVSKV